MTTTGRRVATLWSAATIAGLLWALAAPADAQTAPLAAPQGRDTLKQLRAAANAAILADRARLDVIERRLAAPIPLPPPTILSGIAIDGLAVSFQSLGSIATPSGTWPTYHLGAVAEGKAYLFTYDAKPGWWSICIVRWPGYDDPALKTISERTHRVAVGGEMHVLTVLPGSMKCVDNGEPVKADMARLAAAVQAGRIVPYGTSAFAGMPGTPSISLPRGDIAVTAYNPSRIYGRSSSLNAVGVISGQGGEYHSSRGFVSSEDAVLIIAALASDADTFGKAAARNRDQMLWGLSLPHFAVWSRNHHALRDPQIPLAGDGAYVNEGKWTDRDNFANEGTWCASANYPYLAEIGATAGMCYPHTRDASHLFNHGYAYWLATGDPRAALLQQATAAYALASVWQGVDADGSYRGQFEYQRWTLNLMTAMWKLRDVAMHASGPLLWDTARADRMVANVMDDWTANIALMDTPGAVLPWKTAAQTAQMSAFRLYDATEAASDFMAQIYGPEAAYLWARAGRGEMLTRLAKHMVIRAGDIGGTRGVDNPQASTLLIIDGSATTKAAIVAKFNLERPGQPSDSFDGSEAHTVVRAYWLLRMAKDAATRGWIAPVVGIDAAIAKMETARSRTANWLYLDLLLPKHGGVVFP